MDFEYTEFKGMTFPVRSCGWERNGRRICRLVGSELLLDAINRLGGFGDEEAVSADEGIAYYVPHEVLLECDDDELLGWIIRNVDDGLADEFGRGRDA